MKAPTRPALRYYGGKWNLAPWIISHFPAHKNYVEPCGGAASVLLQKPRSALETYNDLDGNVVNFFRVLRDRPDELIQKIKLTPWAREEYDNCLIMGDEPIEAARRMFVRSWCSRNGATNFDNQATSGFQTHMRHKDYPTELYFDALNTVAARFIGVQIEQRDALAVIESYSNDDSLIYFDPPYVKTERTKQDWYAFEWDEEAHRAAAGVLLACDGLVVMSGYASPLYTDLYEAHGWARRDREAQTNSGGKRVESIWLSPRTVQALDGLTALPMFAQVAP